MVHAYFAQVFLFPPSTNNSLIQLLRRPKNVFRYLYVATLSGYVVTNMKSVKYCDFYLRSSSSCRRTRFVCIKTKNVARLLFPSKTKETFKTT